MRLWIFSEVISERSFFVFFCFWKSFIEEIVSFRFLGLSFRAIVGLSVRVIDRFSNSGVRGVLLGEFVCSSGNSSGSWRIWSSVKLSLDSRGFRSERG